MSQSSEKEKVMEETQSSSNRDVCKPCPAPCKSYSCPLHDEDAPLVNEHSHDDVYPTYPYQEPLSITDDEDRVTWIEKVIVLIGLGSFFIFLFFLMKLAMLAHQMEAPWGEVISDE